MSVLVDTSIWIDHLRSNDPALVSRLDAGEVLVHPWVVGELTLGGSTRRREVRDLLLALPRPVVGSDAEVVELIEDRALHGRGIGYVDAGLFTATVLTRRAALWTRDQSLADTARDPGVGAEGPLPTG